MGCTLAVARPRPTAQVLLPSAAVHSFDGGPRTTTADLMLEFPGHFLVDSASIHVGRRFVPLSADDLLEAGRLYVLFPMARINTFANAIDVGRLHAAGDEAVRRTRVLPTAPLRERKFDDVDEEEEGARVKMGDVGAELEEERRRLSVSRSRPPALETIVETD